MPSPAESGAAGQTRRARRLAARLARHRRHYTAEEDAYLVDHWEGDNVRQLARWLKRTESAIVDRAAQLGLSRRDGSLRLYEVGLIVGVAPRRVRYWLRLGWLPGRRLLGEEAPDRLWAIAETDLLRFFREHPEQYDWRRVDASYQRFARRACADEVWLTTSQAAELLGCSRITARRLIERGALPARPYSPDRHSGGKLLIPRSAVRAWLARAGEQAADHEAGRRSA